MNLAASHVTRPAVRADAESIARLHAESWQDAYRGLMRDAWLDNDALANRMDVWTPRLAQPSEGQFVRVAETKGTLVGFVCAFAHEDPRWGSLIDNLHVTPRLRGTGIGKRLMADAVEWLSANAPAAGVYLWVLAGNTSARRFYESLHGRNEGEESHHYPDGSTLPTCRYSWPRASAISLLSPQSRS